ncbi:Cof-type HAD-IIB family hydrolase [Mycoplasma iguanae]|uniref:Cof-type HAD-IIB family hydrolase n=1 Tax=Mycoplasma iguanae TaxID=292461 RepID=A0ABY5R7T9_9MOLU|nr:HAD family hydrolase [Mycoplasma iguanae]UVD81576.1 Cof-type HAD-IIB family hydrolase [Mycoplasma iguanae]
MNNKFNQIKVFAFDVDGTILPYGQEEVSTEIEYMFEKLKQKRYTTVVATGRDMLTIGSIINVANIDYFIGANGAFIYDMKEKSIIWEALFDFDDYKKIEDFLLNKEVCPFSVMTENAAFNSEGFDLNNWFLEKYQNDFQDLSKLNREEKIHIITVKTGEDEFIDKVSKFIEENNLAMEINSKWSKGFFIAPKGINKASTISVLCKLLNKEWNIENHVMAFGDSSNDVHMIKEAAWGVVVEDAYQELKNIANDIAPSASENGTKLYLEKQGII